METVDKPGQSRLAGTQPVPSASAPVKYCAWFGIAVSGVKPLSSIACQYNSGLIDQSTWLFVFILALSNLYVLKLMPPTQSLTSPVIGSITIKAVCSI